METPAPDTVLPLLDRLCRIRSFRLKNGGQGEQGIAEFISEFLRQFPWLTVEIEKVPTKDPSDEGFCNVFAYSGKPSEIRFLVVGHLDTVSPSGGWSVEEFSERDGRYYALGAIDTKAGIGRVP